MNSGGKDFDQPVAGPKPESAWADNQMNTHHLLCAETALATRHLVVIKKGIQKKGHFMRATRVLLATAVASVTIVTMFPSSAPASHSWGTPPYHWARTANPFTLKLGDNVSGAWDLYLTNASSDWSLTPPGPLPKVLNTTVVAGNAGSRCRPTAGRVEVCAKSYGSNGWLGLAQIWISGNHITQGTTKMNDTYFSTSAYNTPAWRSLVMCQEVGHTFGLGHQDEIFGNTNLGTCMDYTDDPSTNMHPNAHDFEQLSTIYSHLDSTTTLAATPASVGQGTFDTPETWGRKTHSSNAGKHEQFERDLGNGNLIITEVIWVDDTLLGNGDGNSDRGKADGDRGKGNRG